MTKTGSWLAFVWHGRAWSARAASPALRTGSQIPTEGGNLTQVLQTGAILPPEQQTLGTFPQTNTPAKHVALAGFGVELQQGDQRGIGLARQALRRLKQLRSRQGQGMRGWSEVWRGVPTKSLLLWECTAGCERTAVLQCRPGHKG